MPVKPENLISVDEETLTQKINEDPAFYCMAEFMRLAIQMKESGFREDHIAAALMTALTNMVVSFEMPIDKFQEMLRKTADDAPDIYFSVKAGKDQGTA